MKREAFRMSHLPTRPMVMGHEVDSGKCWRQPTSPWWGFRQVPGAPTGPTSSRVQAKPWSMALGSKILGGASPEIGCLCSWWLRPCSPRKSGETHWAGGEGGGEA